MTAPPAIPMTPIVRLAAMSELAELLLRRGDGPLTDRLLDRLIGWFADGGMCRRADLLDDVLTADGVAPAPAEDPSPPRHLVDALVRELHASIDRLAIPSQRGQTATGDNA